MTDPRNESRDGPLRHQATPRVTLVPAPYTDLRYGYRAYLLTLVVVVAVVLALVWGLSFSVLFALGAAVWFGLRLALYYRSRRAARAVQQRPGDPRLLCYGNAADLAACRSISDEFFEPVIAQTSWVAESPKSIRILRLLVVGVLVIPAVLLIVVLRQNQAMILGGLLVILFALQMILVHLFPMYYRVVPGRLDVLRYGIRRRNRRVTSIDLRDALIECRFDHGFLRITPGNEQKPPLTIRLYSIRKPRDFGRAVFQAAICRHPAVSLPEDALLG